MSDTAPMPPIHTTIGEHAGKDELGADRDALNGGAPDQALQTSQPPEPAIGASPTAGEVA